jgi:hypothetical protein
MLIPKSIFSSSFSFVFYIDDYYSYSTVPFFGTRHRQKACVHFDRSLCRNNGLLISSFSTKFIEQRVISVFFVCHYYPYKSYYVYYKSDDTAISNVNNSGREREQFCIEFLLYKLYKCCIVNKFFFTKDNKFKL